LFNLRITVTSRPLILLVDEDIPLPVEQADRICRLSSRISFVYGSSKENLQVANVVYSSGATFDPKEARFLQWVQTPSVAVNHLKNTRIARSGIPITNVRGAYAIAVAECAVGLMLSLTRRLHLCGSLQLQGNWPTDKSAAKGENCYGKTLGIIGYGSTGRHLARIAKAMGMRVLACKRRPEIKSEGDVFSFPEAGDSEGRIPELWFGPEQLEEMLKLTDVAVVTLPLTDATRGLVGRRELAALPAKSYVLNVGRGGVIDEAALIEALQSGHLAGAGLDVFSTEPLSTDSLFWKLPNTIVSPHIASYTRDQVYLAAEVLVENLSRFLSNRPLVNVVDMAAGY